MYGHDGAAALYACLCRGEFFDDRDVPISTCTEDGTFYLVLASETVGLHEGRV